MLAGCVCGSMQGTKAHVMKRTRRLTRAQSKYGCLTCKSRKVRCDETQPTCRRCTNSGFTCEGYTATRPVSPSREQSNTSLSRSASTSGPGNDSSLLRQPNIQQKLINILQSSNIAYIGRDALERVIRTTSQLAPSSLTAIPALEILIQSGNDRTADQAESRLQVDTAYGQAIRLFVNEIRGSSGSPDAIFITGIILIAIELLQRRRQDAWKHLLGSRQWLRSTASNDGRSDNVEFLHCIYDLQSLLYSHNVRSPTTGPHDCDNLQVTGFDTLTFADLEQAIVEILHNAHSLISSLHHSDLVETMSTQNRERELSCLADLRTTVRFIERKLQTRLDAQKDCTYLILRNLCQMTIMELEQLRCTEEMSWDGYEEKFQTIIEAAENIQLRDQQATGLTRSAGQLQLTLQLGLIPPLLLTALKFRHPLWRRRAISCLQKAGIEGPFIGKQLAAICQRCVEIEESGSRQSSVSTTPENSCSLPRVNVRMPPEDKRLAHCRTDEDNGSADNISWPPAAKGNTLTLFLARKRPAPVLAAKVLTSTHFLVGNEQGPLHHQTLDTTVWRVWTETIEFDGTSE